MSDILNLPLVVVGGIVSESKSIVFGMHEGYDHPLVLPLETALRLPALDSPKEVWHVGGSRNEPLLSWPIYAAVRGKKVTQ